MHVRNLITLLFSAVSRLDSARDAARADANENDQDVEETSSPSAGPDLNSTEHVKRFQVGIGGWAIGNWGNGNWGIGDWGLGSGGGGGIGKWGK